ncbi:MAG: hypothetical protein UZ20_WS6002000264 [candidate division WS6 bacterium OLB21]|uniref:Uncharacterized protein n=1 Tax=candidate division WS6 bacterium OLB21 TaxID=1617427 RepID=A0A136KJU5_9BACT|nr:MAG: hypothetical protein UZ20_WS6002000264 [candidate division WS6 bacterium OLB21]
MKKLAFYSKQVSKSISKKLASLEITYSDIAIQLFFVIVVIALLFNINTAFTKGQDNIRRIQEEEQRLDDIYAENKKASRVRKIFQLS